MKTHSKATYTYLLFVLLLSPFITYGQCQLMPGSTLIDANDEAQMTGWFGSTTNRGTLIYRMSQHGNTPAAFHNRCDNQGPTLVLIRSGNTGQVFGGYNPQSWTSNSGYVSGTGAFLFNLTYNYKLNQTLSQYQTYNNGNYGPTFGGGHDIYNPMNGQLGYNNPHSYENPSTKGYTYLSSTFQFTATEIEVYKIDLGNIVASGDTNLCAGGSVNLTAPVGDNYLWSTGVTTRDISVNQSGDYSVQVSSANGNCLTITPHQVVTVSSPLSLSISQVNESAPGACDGSVVLQPIGGTAPYNTGGGIDFSGTTINTGLLSYGGPGSTFVQNGNLKMKSTNYDWTNYVFTNQTIERAAGKVFQGKVYAELNTYTMIGWHNSSTNPYYNNLVHAFYFAGGRDLHIFENGSHRGYFGNYAANTWYDFKIELLATGAKYFIKAATSSIWNHIYTSNQFSDTNLRMGLSFHGYIGNNFYTDDWSGGIANPPLVGLCAGTYEYTIMDSFGCTATQQVTITASNPVSFSATSAKPDCSNSSDGSITIAAAGGTAPYQYSIDGGANYQTSNEFVGLPVGSYSLIVKDANNTLSVSQSLALAFEDNIAPTVTTQNITVQLDGLGNATIAAADVNNGSTDNCAIATYALDITDFECLNVGANTVTLTVTDVNGNSASATATVTVEDNEAPIAEAVLIPEVEECSVTVTQIPTARDVCDGWITATTTDPLTYTTVGEHIITWTYTDSKGNISSQEQLVVVRDSNAPVPDVATLPNVLGECNASATAPTAKDACAGIITGTTTDATTYNTQGTYTITWTFDDGHGNLATQSQTVIVKDITPPSIATNGNQTVVNDAGKCGAMVGIMATASDNCSVGTPTGVRSDGIALDGLYPVGETTITWTVTDANGNVADPVAQTVKVTNLAPAIISVTSSDADGLFPKATPVTLTVNYTDTNVTTAKINWDDITSIQTISNPANEFSAPHNYAEAGVYTVTITVTDACNLTAEYKLEYLVVYDPSAGFVTGGGWIESPQGAYEPDASLVGKASFGFVSKYQKGATIPTGNTEFQFKAGNLNFASTSYQWLVVSVSGYKAQYKGVGTINGIGGYKFLLTAIDGERQSTPGPDKFRIKITDDSEVAVYDNQRGAIEDSEASTAIGGGSIVIHTPKSGKRDGGDDAIGDKELSASVSAYPNPVDDVIYVKFVSESQAPIGMQLIDITGRNLKSESYQANPDGAYEMPVSNLELKSGLYLLRIIQERKIKTIKVIKR